MRIKTDQFKRLRPAPIRCKSLSSELIQRIECVYKLLGPYLSSNLEQFELAFMRDQRPEIEVAIWCRIAAAWSVYHRKYTRCKKLSVAAEKRLVSALISISMDADSDADLGVDAETASRLRVCYERLN